MSNSSTTTIPSYKQDLQGLIAQLSEMLPAEALNTFNQDAQMLAETHTAPLKVKVGEVAPKFSLPNATGEVVALQNLLESGKVVLVIYRGTWCPYCNLALSSYQKILPEIKAAGAQLVALSLQTPDQSLDIKQKNELAFEVLSDGQNEVIAQYTTVFKNGEAPVQAMKDLGIDFHSFYETNEGVIPVPAVFIIGQDGKVQFAEFASGDYRERTEPQAILDALK
ncbi:redoxin [marine bacterium AO1-C]|nr:redoxin [marine bacterium AO1-C]